jgi:hypothetical protein
LVEEYSASRLQEKGGRRWKKTEEEKKKLKQKDGKKKKKNTLYTFIPSVWLHFQNAADTFLGSGFSGLTASGKNHAKSR